MKNNERTLVIVLIGVLALVLGWKFFFTTSVNDREIDKALEKVVIPEVTKKQASNIESVFPSFIPLNGKTQVIDLYEAKYPNSTIVQISTVFASSVAADRNFEYYKKWAVDNGWTIANSTSADLQYSLYLKKNSEIINLVIAREKITISYVKK